MTQPRLILETNGLRSSLQAKDLSPVKSHNDCHRDAMCFLKVYKNKLRLSAQTRDDPVEGPLPRSKSRVKVTADNMRNINLEYMSSNGNTDSLR